jgi:ABC-2 type transport system permease protein
MTPPTTIPPASTPAIAGEAKGPSMSNTATNLVALHTIVRREIVRIMRIWTQTLIPPAITMTLYFVIFGKLIGSRIGTIQGGFSYMQYIVPGLVMMSIITNSYGNISSSFFGAKFSRAVEEMLVSPMPNWVILLGYVTGAVTRGLVVGVLVLLIALFFTSLHVAHPLITFFSVLLGATIFSLAGFVNAVYAKKFDDIALVPTFVLTPLTYLGGVFYSVNMLGEPWQAISRANPILYMVNAFRFGVLGISDVNIGVAFVVMLGFVAALSIVALQLLKRGVGLRS